MATQMLTSKSHNGTHNLKFEVKRHIYWLDEKIVPGVTTVNKKGFPTNEKLLNWFKRNGQNSTRIANEAADVGKIVHKYAEHTANGESGKFDWSIVESHKHKIQIKNCIRLFTSWWEKNTTRTMGTELLIASPTYNFGGMIDRLALNTQDELGIEDYKTSSGFFIDQFVQQAGYKIAAYEWLNMDIKWLRINLFGKQDGDFHTLLVNQEGWYLDEKIYLADKFAMLKLQNQFVSNRKTYGFVDEYEPMFDDIYKTLKAEIL